MAQGKAKQVGGFERAGVGLKHRLIVCSEAMAGCGKTNFGLSMPGPLAIVNLDEGLDGVIQEFQQDKEIWVANYRLAFADIKATIANASASTKAVADESMRIWNAVQSDYIEALQEAKSVFVDTGTEMNELLRLAHFGKLTQIMPHHYMETNRVMKSLVDLAYESSVNVLFSHRLKKEYAGSDDKNRKPTGEMELAGWKEMGYECQIHVRQWKDPKEPFPARYHMTVLKCRPKSGVHLEGEDFAGEMINFPTIASAIFQDSEDDWK